MTFWRPSRPSPAMLVALLALCVALGGTAIATTTSNGGDPAAAAAKKKRKLVPKNTVNSASVINNSLKLTDFKKAVQAKPDESIVDYGVKQLLYAFVFQ